MVAEDHQRSPSTCIIYLYTIFVTTIWPPMCAFKWWKPWQPLEVDLTWNPNMPNNKPLINAYHRSTWNDRKGKHSGLPNAVFCAAVVHSISGWLEWSKYSVNIFACARRMPCPVCIYIYMCVYSFILLCLFVYLVSIYMYTHMYIYIYMCTYK